MSTMSVDQHWTHGGSAAVDATLRERCYERFAGHAVQIGDRITFQATGTAVRAPARSIRSRRAAWWCRSGQSG
ncbi:hypothetical protein B2J96_02340 [Mycobacterium shigaense]|nr:hypothetical protein B2J96_02340 [Mycobacterium shigaense]